MKTRDEIRATTFEAAETLDIEKPRLREWISRKYIVPAEPSIGRGTKAYLDRINHYQIAVFDHLVRRGISREIASFVVRGLRKTDLEAAMARPFPLFISLVSFKDSNFEQSTIFSSDEYHLKLVTEDVQVDFGMIVDITEIIKAVDRRLP